MREWIARMLDWFRRDELSRELEEELRFHREQLALDAGTEVVPAGDRQRITVHRMGDTLRVREAAWERWSIPYLDQLQQDVRHALRGLRGSPSFTVTVILTLALGMGANVAMFTVVDRLMFRSLAYMRDPDAVHRVYWRWSDHGSVVTSQSTQYARYLDLIRWTTSFSQLAAFSERALAVGDGESLRERRVGVVSASYFDFFDVRPALGRFFVAAEDVTPRGADVAVLSHAFWHAAYGARDVLGEVLQIGDVRATIIGVAPAGFAGVNDANPPDVFIPITTFAGSSGTEDARTYFSRYRWGWVHVLVRRKADVPVEEAEADASRAFGRSWQAARLDDPTSPTLEAARPHVTVSSVRPGAGPDPGLEARTSLWVASVAGIVLLIACANVANLFLARVLRQRRETAVRLALGVTRRRLLTRWLAESLVLALIGGVAAVLVAQWAGAAIRGSLLGARAPVLVIGDVRTLAVAFGLACTAGVLVGMIPACLCGRGDVSRMLRGGARGGVSEGSRVRAALLIVQAALSVILLSGAVLFVRSVRAVEAMPMGYDAGRVLLVNRVIRGQAFTDSAQHALRRILSTTAQSLPGVESAAWVSSAPFVSTSYTNLYVEGIDSVARLGTFTYQATTPDYFRTMGTRILRGRGLIAEDRYGSPAVAVVSESMARVLWPGRNAIGQCFRMRADTVPCTTVVGVAQDMVQRDITGDQRYHYYLSIEQFTRTWGNGMVLRLRGDPVREAEDIRAALQRVLPGTSYVTVRPLREIVDDAQRSWRLGATMFVAFGALALVVAAVGLYGVVAFSVNQRMHEWSVRVALGATRAHVLRIVIRQSAGFTAAGAGAGIAVALLLAGRIEPLLFRQSASDPRVYAFVAAALFAVAVVAAAIPASRAAGADPNQALRAE
jgi:predicted permease